jgi:5-methyltetrahydrofolate--homocysteine methyltransferase
LRSQRAVAATPGRPPRGRFSFGYPDCPDLEAQRPLLELLGASRIGLGLSESAQLVPEHSLSALVLHQPEAGVP